jgi:hypothetical protein
LRPPAQGSYVHEETCDQGGRYVRRNEGGTLSNRVVARFQDGRMVKGISLDVDPAKPVCHVRPPGDKAVEVTLADLKALFFVRSLDGNPGYEESRLPKPGDRRLRGSNVVSLQFADGEKMVGLTIRYPPNKPYFFITPVDPKSNNIRILINRAAVVAMELVDTG